jgi:hypothetical protein
MFAMDSEDLWPQPLSMRKTHLERLLRGRPDGIFIIPFEAGAIGPTYSARRATWGWRVRYRNAATGPTGQSKDWIKVKNRAHQALTRVRESFA